MMKYHSSEFVKRLLKRLPAELGKVTEFVPDDDPRLVMIFQNEPWNWSSQLACSNTMRFLVDSRLTSLIGVDGNTGPIMTFLFRIIPDERVREMWALDALKRVSIGAAEHCGVTSDEEVTVWGVDDRELYIRSAEAQKAKNVSAFANLEQERAATIATNLVDKMEEMGEEIAILFCAGRLPRLVGKELKKRKLSYAMIRPAASEPSDFESYIKRAQENMDAVAGQPYEYDEAESPNVAEMFSKLLEDRMSADDERDADENDVVQEP